MILQPVAEPLELGQLLAILRAIPVGVVSDQHLREVRVIPLDVRRKVLAVLEVERVLPGALGRHRQREPSLAGLLGHIGAELLVDQDPGDGRVRPGANGAKHALEDEVLGVSDYRRLLRVRFAVDSEELLLKGAAVIEREDVQLPVVAERHRLSIPKARQPRSGGP